MWRDPWVPWIDDYMPRPRDDSIPLDPLMVSSLIDSSTHCWKQENLTELFDTDSVNAIKRIHIPIRPKPNRLIWLGEPFGWEVVSESGPTISNPEDIVRFVLES